jgi:hypothetical protein
MKKIYLFVITFCLILSACGNNDNNPKFIETSFGGNGTRIIDREANVVCYRFQSLGSDKISSSCIPCNQTRLNCDLLTR